MEEQELCKKLGSHHSSLLDSCSLRTGSGPLSHRGKVRGWMSFQVEEAIRGKVEAARRRRHTRIATLTRPIRWQESDSALGLSSVSSSQAIRMDFGPFSKGEPMFVWRYVAYLAEHARLMHSLSHGLRIEWRALAQFLLESSTERKLSSTTPFVQDNTSAYINPQSCTILPVPVRCQHLDVAVIAIVLCVLVKE